jgi:soluble lytic murein transglycosylase-like protein
MSSTLPHHSHGGFQPGHPIPSTVTRHRQTNKTSWATPGTIAFRAFVVVLMLAICGLQLIGLKRVSEWQAHEQAIEKHVAVVQAEISNLRALVNTDMTEEMIGLKILVLSPRVPNHTARAIASAIHKYAPRFQRDPDLVLSIMRIESDFDPRATSKMGAMGLMQVMPQWIDVLDIQCDLYDPECNVKYGLQILGAYEQLYGDLDMALTAFNRGPGPVDYALMRGKDPDNGYAGKIRAVQDRLRAINGLPAQLEVAYTK